MEAVECESCGAIGSALVPTHAQEVLLRQAVGVSHFVYNWALAEWKRQYQAGGKPNEAALRWQLNAINREQFPWMGLVPKSVPQHAIKNCGAAFEQFGHVLSNGLLFTGDTYPPRPPTFYPGSIRPLQSRDRLCPLRAVRRSFSPARNRIFRCSSDRSKDARREGRASLWLRSQLSCLSSTFCVCSLLTCLSSAFWMCSFGT
jgi:hypothetical protein